ncbi:hypothetical protein [Larkinella soli]|uniref:hypothetical protein n=1 Tax=Larkinella soli TaxID=1770527 RepID=UPI000FFB6B4E|nr:hypothetical protein [Larkinella soli]
MQIRPILLLCLLAWVFTGCQSTKNNQSGAVINGDTTIVLQTVIDAFKPDWERTFEGQPIRILPNKFINPGTKMVINGRPVTYPQADSSLMDSLFSKPKFFATINIFRFPTDSTAHVDLTFLDIGRGGEFKLLRKPQKGWIIVWRQFYII